MCDGQVGPIATIHVDDLDNDTARSLLPANEITLRRKLACLYRILDHFGWTQVIYNHITVRTSPDSDTFLINPFGLQYREVTAGSLVKVNSCGGIINEGTTRLGISRAGYTLHSAIHAARPEIQCVIHVHTVVGAAVSSMECGLLPICQEALIAGKVSYHPYSGILVDERERVEIARNLGPDNMVMILHNHGLVALGRSVEEAYHYLYHLIKACQVQVHVMGSGGPPSGVIVPGKDVQQQVMDIVTRGGGGVSSGTWAVGELEFEALVREQEAKGCKTGLQLRTSALINVGLSGDISLANDSQQQELVSNCAGEGSTPS